MSRASEVYRARREIARKLELAKNYGTGGGHHAAEAVHGGSAPSINLKKLFVTKADANFNMEPFLVRSIRNCDYYRCSARRLESFEKIVDEIYKVVEFFEPWQTLAGTRTPSPAFCLLLRLCELGVTRKQLQCLLDHKDSPFIRVTGFCFLRFVCPPSDFFSWIKPYLIDKRGDERFTPQKSSSRLICIREFLKLLIESSHMFGCLLPRFPVSIQNNLHEMLKDADQDRERLLKNSKRKDIFKAGTTIVARYTEDDQWYDAVVDGPGYESETLAVTYADYGNSEDVGLGSVRLPDEPERVLPKSPPRRDRSRDYSSSNFPNRSRSGSDSSSGESRKHRRYNRNERSHLNADVSRRGYVYGSHSDRRHHCSHTNYTRTGASHYSAKRSRDDDLNFERRDRKRGLEPAEVPEKKTIDPEIRARREAERERLRRRYE